MNQLNLQHVKLKPSEHPPGELSDKIHYKCRFCGKTSGLATEIREVCERIAGPDHFYCPFCVRNGYYTKSTKDVLVLSFRSILGYFYYALYCSKSRQLRSMWVSEIQDYADAHAKVGLQNPVFNYDSETYLWFVDFSKVGTGRKKIAVDEVLKTITNILSCFNLYEHSQGGAHAYYNKFRDAVVKFHTHRYRPQGRPFLIPTLTGKINVFPKGIKMEDIRDFTPDQLRSK